VENTTAAGIVSTTGTAVLQTDHLSLVKIPYLPAFIDVVAP
jgi:hypothetical protein